MNKKQIKQEYEKILQYYNKHLKQLGVKLPQLINKNGSYTKDALTLIFLAKDYPNTKVISKSELTKLIQNYYPDVNDVQQARHLAAQKGWYIASGTRNDNLINLNPGEYKLISLEKAYPNFSASKRTSISTNKDYWTMIKKAYNYRCATCGSKEGEPNFHWPATITKLQKGHMDPNKPLTIDNIIPQCSKCNQPDKNYWIYDKKGRVKSIANPIVINHCNKSIQYEIYKRLYIKFKGLNPFKENQDI